MTSLLHDTSNSAVPVYNALRGEGKREVIRVEKVAYNKTHTALSEDKLVKRTAAIKRFLADANFLKE